MSSDLQERLAELADEAPRSLAVAGDGLWRAGVRRRRQRRTRAVVATTVATAALAGGLSLLGPHEPRTPVPAEVPVSELHIPRTLHAPDPWAEGTDEAGPPGPLAAISLAWRDTPEGLTGTTRTMDPFGVSAVDGSTVFLDLSSARDDDGTTLLGPGAITLSPDGRKVAYVRHQANADRTSARVIGWDVYDTETGAVTELRVPGTEEIRGSETSEIRFTGDSRYLMTSYSPSGRNGFRQHALFVWDVESGTSLMAEEPGYYWLPNPGSAATGVVWSRGQRIYRLDPSSNQTEVLRLPHDVVEASFGADDALAYIGHRPTRPNEFARWWLYAGDGPDGSRRIPLDIDPGLILGWKNTHEVVVSDHRQTVRLVDVRTGEYDAMMLRWRSAGRLMTPRYAADLWRNPLVDGVAPADLPDPRWWRRPTTWAVAAVGTLAGLVWWRRRRGRA
ncbi:MAG TPA: hypothetical protein VFZ64_02570 [Nocardioidaceae bacterium]